MNKNFLPNQYKTDKEKKISHYYLDRQFSDYKEALKSIETIIKEGDFTLGKEVDRFEANFAKLTQSQYAIGVGSGTDAIMLSLIALGIQPGDEVITTPFTFYATIGAIVTAGATPVFVDIEKDTFLIDPTEIESAITAKTKCIVPVHWSGKIANMSAICDISKRHNIPIVEDACHAILAHQNNTLAGNFGDFGCFSMHPLKNLNIWGDGGIIVTNNEAHANKIRLLRNHGLVNRDTTEIFAYNSRLDTIQAAVANYALEKLSHITDSRIKNAQLLDQRLKSNSHIFIPERDHTQKEVFHLYQFKCNKRDDLQAYLLAHSIDAKVHYPIPMHCQPAASHLGYKRGDFPYSEETCDTVLSLPVHEFVSEDDIAFMVERIETFYNTHHS